MLSTEAGGLLFIRAMPSETCNNCKYCKNVSVRAKEGMRCKTKWEAVVSLESGLRTREAVTVMLSAMSAMSK